MTFPKKHAILPLSIIIICVTLRTFFLYYMSNYPLALVCEDLALEALTNNPIEFHYSIAHPENLNLEDIPKDLVPYSRDFYTEARETWTKHQNSLAEIDTTRLNGKNLFLHSLLTRHVNLQVQSLEFPYYENPLSCSGGVHSQLPILLAEYALRSRADVEDYLTLLSQIPAYMEGMVLYAREQERSGIAQYRGNLDLVSTQCRELFPADQLQEGSHFLQVSFRKKLEKLVAEGLLTVQESEACETRNDSLLSNKIAPAYETLADALSQLEGCPTLAGLCRLPRGKEYYELLLGANTGSSRSVEELLAMLYERYDMLFEEFTALVTKETNKAPIPSGQYAVSGTSSDSVAHTILAGKTPADMLTHLAEASGQFFPALTLPEDQALWQVQLKEVDGLLSDMSAPAFYMTPPVDANLEHTIYINPDAEMEVLDLYTTLAHEGFPGHLYQTVYSQSALTRAGAPLIRQLLYYGGFTEGWAIYAELYAYDFLETDTKGSGSPQSDSSLEANRNETGLSQADCSPEAGQAADTLALARCNREIQLCLCSILDILIHHEGAGLSDVKNVLATLGLNASAAEPIYATICDSPANYPKYYVGYLEILELQKQSRKLWDEDYSDYTFHKWLLETGAADFQSLAQALSNS